MYTYWTPFELEHAFKLTSPTRLFVNARLISSILPVAEKAGIPSERIYVLGGTMEGRRSFKEMIEEARSRNIPKVPARPAAKDTLAYFLFTGGTSGYPKGSINFWIYEHSLTCHLSAHAFSWQSHLSTSANASDSGHLRTAPEAKCSSDIGPACRPLNGPDRWPQP